MESLNIKLDLLINTSIQDTLRFYLDPTSLVANQVKLGCFIKC